MKHNQTGMVVAITIYSVCHTHVPIAHPLSRRLTARRNSLRFKPEGGHLPMCN